MVVQVRALLASTDGVSVRSPAAAFGRNRKPEFRTGTM